MVSFRHAVLGASLLLAGLAIRPASAQEAQLAAIEGYAFHQDTLKPLKNVRIFLNITEGSNGYGTGAVTDENGFYSVSFEPKAEITALEFYGACVGKTTGSVQRSLSVYTPTRPIVYQRNLYLKPPRGSTRCY
jgi:hypothetical protein